MHPDLKKLRKILSNQLRAEDELLEAAKVCRSLAVSDLDGSGAFLLFALYFENLVRLREGNQVDADKYASGVTEVLGQINECLNAIESFDPLKLSARLDSFARIALRVRLP